MLLTSSLLSNSSDDILPLMILFFWHFSKTRMGVAIKSITVSQINEDTATLNLTLTTFCHGFNSLYNPSISLYLLYFILPWLYLSSALLDTSTFYHRLLFFTVPYYTAFHKLNLATSFCHGCTSL